MTALIEFFDTDDTTPLPALLGFDDLSAGTPTSETEVHIHNTGDALATAVQIYVLARTPGDPNPALATFSLDHPVAAQHVIEVRADGVTGTGTEDQETSLTPVGKGRTLSLLDISTTGGRILFVRANPKPGLGITACEVKLVVAVNRVSTALYGGHFESGAQGVLTGTNDGSFSHLFEGGVITAAGSPDNTFLVSDLRLVHKGIPLCLLANTVTTNGNDSAAAALTSGEAYWITVSAGAGAASGVTVTKSVKGTSPLDEADRPAIPSGELLLGYIERKETAVISSGDIDQTDIAYGFLRPSSSVLNALISGGLALVDNALVIQPSTTTVPLTATKDNYVYMRSSGTFEVSVVTIGAAPVKPADRALLVAMYTTDGSGVTAMKDLRPWASKRMWLRLEADNASGFAANDLGRVEMFPSQVDGYIPHGDDAIVTALDASGATSGSTIVDVQYSNGGGTWTSIYTSGSGKRPTVAFGAGDPTASAPFAEVRKVTRNSRWRAKILAVPGSAPAKQATVLVAVELAA